MNIFKNFVKNYQEIKTTTIGFIVLFGVGFLIYKKIIGQEYFIPTLPFVLVMFGIHDKAFTANTYPQITPVPEVTSQLITTTPVPDPIASNVATEDKTTDGTTQT